MKGSDKEALIRFAEAKRKASFIDHCHAFWRKEIIAQMAPDSRALGPRGS